MITTVIVALLARAMVTEVQPIRIRQIPYELVQTGVADVASNSSGHLELSSTKGSDLHNPTASKRNATAALLTFVPKSDFIFSARVKRPQKTDYEGGALVIYAGADCWAKLLFERLNAGTNAVSSAVATPVGDGSYHVRVPSSVNYIWLKIVRADRSFMLYMSNDGVDWQILRDFSLDTAKKVSVGFASQSPLGNGFKASFSDIRFDERRYRDYWKGE